MSDSLSDYDFEGIDDFEQVDVTLTVDVGAIKRLNAAAKRRNIGTEELLKEALIGLALYESILDIALDGPDEDDEDDEDLSAASSRRKPRRKKKAA